MIQHRWRVFTDTGVNCCDTADILKSTEALHQESPWFQFRARSDEQIAHRTPSGGSFQFAWRHTEARDLSVGNLSSHHFNSRRTDRQVRRGWQIRLETILANEAVC